MKQADERTEIPKSCRFAVDGYFPYTVFCWFQTGSAVDGR
jgi:hypothetical protein